MSWYWFALLFGLGPIALALLSLGLMLFFTGTVGLDGLFAATEKQGTLTCWHCQQETPAGRKLCEHCGGELQ
jgi:Zn finger protein HypA/HybF involved in hydrogenase expression